MSNPKILEEFKEFIQEQREEWKISPLRALIIYEALLNFYEEKNILNN